MLILELKRFHIGNFPILTFFVLTHSYLKIMNISEKIQ